MHLFGEPVPELEGAVWIDCLQAGYDVILGRLDGRFGCVDSMIVGLDQLNVGTLASDVFLYGSTAFIVKDMELGLVLVHDEEVVDVFERLDHAFIQSILHQSHDDCVC